VWNSGVMKHGPELSFDDDGRPVLITRAAIPFEEEHRARVRRYLTLMFWRIPALILAAVAYASGTTGSSHWRLFSYPCRCRGWRC